MPELEAQEVGVDDADVSSQQSICEPQAFAMVRFVLVERTDDEACIKNHCRWQWFAEETLECGQGVTSCEAPDR